MVSFEEHCKESLELFSEDGAEFHRWLDQYAERLGYDHRDVLHNKEGVEVGVQLFGERARRHLEQHIRTDRMTDIIPSIDDLRKIDGGTVWKRFVLQPFRSCPARQQR